MRAEQHHRSSILIVDDTPENLAILTTMLTEQGYRIHPAITGEMALEVVRETPIDLILLDIMMPGLDGYDVCRQLKADDATRDIPVLFISALQETGEKVEAFAVGGIDYITKPFQEEEVLARVKTHIDLKLHQDHLEEILNKRTAELKASEEGYRSFAQIGRSLSVERNIEKLLEMILDEARNLSGADAGTLYLVDKSKQLLNFEILHNDTMKTRLGGTSNKKVQLPEVPLFIDGQPNYAHVSSHAALTGKISNIEDVYATEKFDFTGPREYDEKTGYRTKSMLVIPMQNYEGEIIGVLQLINSQDKNTHRVIPFTAVHEDLIASLASQAAIALTNAQLSKDLINAFYAFIKSIATAIDKKSPYTGGHISRVVDLTMLIAEAVNNADDGPLKHIDFNAFEMEELRIAAWMHDVGKITTPEHVVNKSTRLEMITDRIELIETRFHLIAKQMIAAHCQKKLTFGRASALSTEKRDTDTFWEQMEEQFNAELSAHYEDLEFIKSCNQPNKFITREAIEKLHTIAQKSFCIHGVTYPYLHEIEIENLCIPKGSLTDEERKTVEKHADMTYEILKQIPFPSKLTQVPEIASAHHEKIDGSGYPKGLTENDLSLQARIIAIADIFEALTAQDRPYRSPMKLSQVFNSMKAMREDGHIDPNIYDLFVNHKYYLEYAHRELQQEQIDIL